MISLLIIPYLFALAASNTEHSCSQSIPTSPDIHCIHNQVLNFSVPQHPFQRNLQPPSTAKALYLNNCTVDHLPPGALGNATEHLWILDGSAPSVHLSPSLKTFTSLRAGTQQVIIDPVDNFRLKVFDLEGDFRELPKNFQRLRKLEVVDLCVNGYEAFDLDVFNGMDRLRKFNIGWNRLREVTVSSVYLPALKELFLQGNRLTSLDLTGLTAPNLQKLYVSSNQLTSIDGFSMDVPKFPNLVRLDLYGNPWHCDWLALLKNSFKERSVDTLSYLPEKVCDESGTVTVRELQCQPAI